MPENEEDESVYYENCDEARADGAAPLYEGEPGYAPHLDADGDGVACEPYFGDDPGGGNDDGGNGDSDAHYENCDEAMADGAAPLYEGDPGYDEHLDRDGDGVACET
ncbi:excalibur calcium-binding domain-containing protein [Glycomyces luteolus]|uniref:Excalibur calcium-binding domain-containing protein n=1 Tax=Glycomyces luteolus TaxID=2670330 RepID=A0A9X3PDX8_9ACTN|nr:excalibur calcium-binding domain-containing protein [Glycomyces luteolus]MDA1361778.1 excalibur calcium-binding domain-containing protein [Glycomyces luteolus]